MILVLQYFHRGPLLWWLKMMSVSGNQSNQSIIAERSERDSSQLGTISSDGSHPSSVAGTDSDPRAGSSIPHTPTGPSTVGVTGVAAGRHRRTDSGGSSDGMTPPSSRYRSAAQEGFGGCGGGAGSTSLSVFGRVMTKHAVSSGSDGSSGMSRLISYPHHFFMLSNILRKGTLIQFS